MLNHDTLNVTTSKGSLYDIPLHAVIFDSYCSSDDILVLNMPMQVTDDSNSLATNSKLGIALVPPDLYLHYQT